MQIESPEKHGISSENILKLIKSYNDAGLNMHDVIIARHGKIIFETYWEPFNKDFAHRLYSVTKSFVAIAIGFIIQDGLADLDDKILKHFPEYEATVYDELTREQTIRNMLMMSTARVLPYWFGNCTDDRLRFYFEAESVQRKRPGTIFEYDSNGSFVLGALVEKLSGKTLLEYLREKLFDKIGMSQNIECLKCPGGHAWGDSALIMPARDLLKFAQFVMDKGSYMGKQLLDAKYVTDATSRLIDDIEKGVDTYDNKGYGYQIWRTYDNGFSFNGMGCQFAICVPDKDLIFICNADNQGVMWAARHLFTEFFKLISRTAVECELPENKIAETELKQYCSNMKLTKAEGEKHTSFADEINGKEFYIMENDMGIEKFTLKFNGDKGMLCYTNKQGYKELNFGMCENEFSLFPETGYSKEYGGLPCEGHQYKCAASASWVEERKIYIRVQVIDKYFGNLHIVIGFDEEGRPGVYMQKYAEHFFNEYQGYAAGK